MDGTNILVTAATGLTGRSAVTALLKKGHTVRALANPEDDRSRALSASEVVVNMSQAAHQDFEQGLFRGLHDDVERITGTPPMSPQQFIAANREAFL